MRRLGTFTVAAVWGVGLYVTSYIGHAWPTVSALGVAGAGLAAAVLGWKAPKVALGMLLLELVVGSHGRALTWFGGEAAPSLRQAIFVGALVGWAAHRVVRGETLLAVPRPWRAPWLLTIALVALSGLRGLLANGTPALLDGNGYLFLLLAPMAFAVLQTSDWSWLARLAAGGSLALSLLTVGLVALFAWQPFDVEPVYRWIRDQRLGEITYAGGTFFRVFFPSHIFSLAVALGALAVLANQNRLGHRLTLAAAAVGSLAVVASLSRSLWLGAAAGGVALVVLLRRRFSWSYRRLVRVVAACVIVLLAEVAVLQLVTGNVGPGAFGARLTRFGGEPAFDARAAQLQPVLRAVGEHPIIGAAFGSKVTYRTTDPRRAQESDGWVSTEALELGWLDTWLDLGLLGVLALGWWLWLLVRWGWTGQTAGATVTLAVVVGLAVTHLTTPYLNHPLGLGLVIALAALTPRPHAHVPT